MLVIRAIRRSDLKPSYSILWIGVALFLISVPAFEGLYRWIAHNVLGILDARHTIYSALIGFLLLYALYLTTKVTRLDDRIQQLISFTAILDKELRTSRDSDSEGATALADASGGQEAEVPGPNLSSRNSKRP